MEEKDPNIPDIEVIEETYPTNSIHGEYSDMYLLDELNRQNKKVYEYKNFTNTWTQIKNRLHENSGLQDPYNAVSILFDLTIGMALESFDDFIDDHLLQAFILTSEGAHLDRIGDEYGVYRISETESDDHYRQRIFNSIILTLSIIFIERQGIRNYSKRNRLDDSRIYLTSNNPHTHNVYDSVPMTDEGKKFLLNQLIYDEICNPHYRGW